jgi:hypothetical protein
LKAQAAPRKERADRERQLEGLAVEVLTALGERDATIAATEQRAGEALQAMMITDEHLTESETVQWCAGTISRRTLPGFGSWLPTPRSLRNDASHLTGI